MGWFTKAFKRDHKDPGTTPPPSRADRSATNSRGVPGSNGGGRKSGLGLAGPSANGTGAPTPNRVTNSDRSMHLALLERGAASAATPNRREQQDRDLALAYSLALQEHRSQVETRAQTVARRSPPQPVFFSPMPSLGRGRPLGQDILAASALADSQYEARQANELARASEAAYEAEVNRVLEASLKTASYDDLLRDIKLWSIDLAAVTEDVADALDRIVHRRKETQIKLTKAADANDERKVRKLTWMAEQLPAAESRVRDLAEQIAPVGVAVTQLQDLRDTVTERWPPIGNAEGERDDIIAKLFKDLNFPELLAPLRSGDVSLGSSVSKHNTAANVRDLLTELLEQALKIPKMPRQRSTTSLTSGSTFASSPAAAIDFDKRSSKTSESDIDAGVSANKTDTPGSSPYLGEGVMDPRALSPGSQLGGAPFHKHPHERQHSAPSTPRSPSQVRPPSSLLESAVLPHDLIGLSLDHSSQEPNSASTPPDQTGLLQKPSLGLDAASADPATDITDQPILPPPSASLTFSTTFSSPSSSAATRNPFLRLLSSSASFKKETTTPVPFQLSTSKPRANNSGTSRLSLDEFRRIPSLVTLHNELQRDRGVVAQTIAWRPGHVMPASGNSNSRCQVAVLDSTIPAPHAAAAFEPANPLELVEFVRAHDALPHDICTVPMAGADRWTTMQAAAASYHVLSSSAIKLSTWSVPEGSSPTTECYRLVESVADVSVKASVVAHPHEPLRQAMARHRLQFDESVLHRLRRAAHHAALVVMRHALQCSEAAQRAKGSWQRGAVLQPLGHAVMAAFAVHQLAGGFAGEAASVCEQLVDLTMHQARGIDPKWFRGHKVVCEH
jgi:hypothetical protein